MTHRSDEIDAQREEIEEVAHTVIEAAMVRDRWHIVHYILARLYELLRFHFEAEESVMRIVAFPEVAEHKQVRKDILLMVERMKVASLDPKACEHESLQKQFSFLTHIVDQDKKVAEFAITTCPAYSIGVRPEASQGGGLRRRSGLSVADAVDRAGIVVGDQQRAVGQH